MVRTEVGRWHGFARTRLINPSKQRLSSKLLWSPLLQGSSSGFCFLRMTVSSVTLRFQETQYAGHTQASPKTEYEMQHSIFRLCTSILLLVSAQAFAQMPASFHRTEAEVAADQANRMQGLMHRNSMPANHGMLFVFTTADRHCMWMRNTLLPLSVAFLDEQGRILNIENMKPKTETSHCAAAPARFALEMNLDWFSRKGIKPGQRIGGVEKSPKPR